MKTQTIDRLLAAHVAVGFVSSFVLPPLSAACMGGAIYLLAKRGKAEEEEMLENVKQVFQHPDAKAGLNNALFGKTNRDN